MKKKCAWGHKFVWASEELVSVLKRKDGSPLWTHRYKVCERCGKVKKK